MYSKQKMIYKHHSLNSKYTLPFDSDLFYLFFDLLWRTIKGPVQTPLFSWAEPNSN